LKRIVLDTGEEVLGYKSKKTKEGMTSGTWKTIEERGMKEQEINMCQDPVQMRVLQVDYNDLKKKVKEECRKDESMYMERRASEVEKVAKMQNLKGLFEKTKHLAGGQKRCPAVKDKECQLMHQ
jgi:hypothetical protein